MSIPPVSNQPASSLLGKRSFVQASELQEKVEDSVKQAFAFVASRAKRARLEGPKEAQSQAVKKVEFAKVLKAYQPLEGLEGLGKAIKHEFEAPVVFTDRVSSRQSSYMKRLSSEKLIWPDNSNAELDHVEGLKGCQLDSLVLLKSVTLKQIIDLSYFPLVTKYKPCSIDPSLNQVRHAISNEFIHSASLLYKGMFYDEAFVEYSSEKVAEAFLDLILFRDKLDAATKETVGLERIQKGIVELLKTKNQVKATVSKEVFCDLIKVGSQKALQARKLALTVMDTIQKQGGDFEKQLISYLAWLKVYKRPDSKALIQDVKEALYLGVPPDVVNAPEFASCHRSILEKSWGDDEEKEITLTQFQEHEMAEVQKIVNMMFEKAIVKRFLHAWKGLA